MGSNGLAFVWGGASGAQLFGDGAKFDPATNTWTPLSAIGAPAPRQNASAISISNNRVFVYGGINAQGTGISEGYIYSFNSDTWESVPFPAASTGVNCSQTALGWNESEVFIWIKGSGLTFTPFPN